MKIFERGLFGRGGAGIIQNQRKKDRMKNGRGKRSGKACEFKAGK